MASWGEAEAAMRRAAERRAMGEGLGTRPVAETPPESLDAAAALAAAVSHDLGNLLTVVLGNAELLGEAVEASPELAELSELIVAAARRGTALTARLDRFARRVPLAPGPVDAGEVLAGFARQLAAELPPGIVLELQVAPDLQPVGLAPSALVSALEELVANAIAVMAGRGRLRLAAANRAAGGATRVRICVEDDGPGAEAETLRRLAEPRFTAGVVGHRLAMGLAIATRVARAAGGELLIDSAPGWGTAVSLDLPAAPPTVA